MTGYITRRLLLAIPTVLGATIILFMIMRVAPGDVVTVIVGEGSISQEQRASIRHELGLDEPLPVQYLDWLRSMVSIHPGKSLITEREIAPDVGGRLLVSAELAIGAILLSILIAIPLGTLSALRQDSPTDFAVRVLSIGGLSLPSFWIAGLALLLSGKYLGWLPPISYQSLRQAPLENLKQMFLPMMILGYALSATVARMTRSSVLDVLGEDYIRTARAKGLSSRIVTVRHVLRNAMLPVITISGAQLGYLLGGTVIMESIFVIPGLGIYTLEGIQNRDYPVVQFTIVLMALFQVLANLITDLCYAALDPRIRYGH